MKIATWNLDRVRPGLGARSARIREALGNIALREYASRDRETAPFSSLYPSFRGVVTPGMLGTAEAVHLSARWQHRRATGVRLGPEASCASRGTSIRSGGANGPVGTRVGRHAFERILDECGLSCVTGGNLDPFQARGWRANIDHVVLSQGLRVTGSPIVWPEQFPLPMTLSDHHRLCVTVADA